VIRAAPYGHLEGKGYLTRVVTQAANAEHPPTVPHRQCTLGFPEHVQQKGKVTRPCYEGASSHGVPPPHGDDKRIGHGDDGR
jgi:hypothetical protein